MSTELSNAVSIHPYFNIREGNLEAFTALMPAFVDKTSTEPGCLYYDFTLHGNMGFCREAYIDAEALLAHISNVTELLGKFLELSDLARLEIHGPAEEIEKLRAPLADLKPDFFVRVKGLLHPHGSVFHPLADLPRSEAIGLGRSGFCNNALGIPFAAARSEPTTLPRWQLSPPHMALAKIPAEGSFEYFQHR